MDSMKRQNDMTLNDELSRLVGDRYATGKVSTNSAIKNKEAEPKHKPHPVVDVTGVGSKVQCCEKQYCIGAWNVRSMDQDKMKVVKQEMVRVNIDILGISELKWTGWENLIQIHYIYYLEVSTLRRNGVAPIVNKRV